MARMDRGKSNGHPQTEVACERRCKESGTACVVNYPQQKGVNWSLLTASDEWGWTILPPAGIAPDTTEILSQVTRAEASGNPTSQPRLSIAPNQLAVGLTVYNAGFPATSANVSFQWGSSQGLQGFRRRVSLAVTSMPVNLLLSSLETTHCRRVPGGICLAMGVLGRKKGLNPTSLVFDAEIPSKEGMISLVSAISSSMAHPCISTPSL